MGNNGGWSYFWSWVTGALATLSLQDIVFAGGAAVTAIFTYLTYRSNDRRNKASIAAEQEKTRLYRELIESQKGKPVGEYAAAVGVIGQQIVKAETEAEA